MRALAALALCGVPFAGVHAVRPIRAQEEALRASFSGGAALANETRGGDDAGEPLPARPDARDALSCAEGDQPIGLRWPDGWTRTTHEQRERALGAGFPGPEDADSSALPESSAAAASRRLLLKLAPLLLGEKDTLRVGAVGGSVTLGDVRRPDLAYPALFAAGLTEAMRLADGGEEGGEGTTNRARNVSVVAANGAMGGTGSGYFALCINRHLAMDLDIVLVELNVNDGTDRSFERVHRKILDRDARPAVVDVLAEYWKEKPADAADAADARHGFSREVVPGEQWRARLETLAHYAVPYVSQAEALAPEVSRDSIAAFPDAARGAFAPEAFLRATDVAHVRNHTFNSAGVHLTTFGHEILAELLLHAVFRVVQRYAACRGALERALAAARRAEAALEASRGGRGVGGSLRGDVADRPGGVDSCVSPEALLAATVSGVARRFARPDSDDGFLSKSASDAAASDPEGSEKKGLGGGWALAANASPNTGEKKWGVETSTPGAAWTVSLDTRVVRSAKSSRSSRDARVRPATTPGEIVRDDVPSTDPALRENGGWAEGSVVTVAYLASYENMGVADGACGGSCACAPFSIDATWDKPTSELALFEVHTAPPTEDCRITLRLRGSGRGEEGDADAGSGVVSPDDSDDAPSDAKRAPSRGRTRFKVLQMTVQEEFVEADRARAAMQEAGGAENAFRANMITKG